MHWRLAAGRLPPRAGAALGETTATLTLATLPRVSELPGGCHGHCAGGRRSDQLRALRQTLHPSRLERRRPEQPAPVRPLPPLHRQRRPPGSHRQRNAGQPPRTAELAWHRAGHRDWRCRVSVGLIFGVQGPGLLDRLGGSATPTAGAVSLLSPTPVLLPGWRSRTLPASPTAAPLATAIATIPVITVIAPTPVPVPRRRRNMRRRRRPTPRATAHCNPYPLADATANTLPQQRNGNATPTACGPDPTQVACMALFDEALRAYVQGLSPEQQAALGCPYPALTGQAWSWPFERGFIVRFDEAQTISWSTTIRGNGNCWSWRLAQPPPAEFQPRRRSFSADRVEAAVWASDGRRDRFGYALTPEPGQLCRGLPGFHGRQPDSEPQSGESSNCQPTGSSS